jgi:hypothetical protein
VKTTGNICEAYSLKQRDMTKNQWILEINPTIKDHLCELGEPIQLNLLEKTTNDTELREMRVFNLQRAGIT